MGGHAALLILVSAVAGLGAGVLNPAQQASIADIVRHDRNGGPAIAAVQMSSDLGSIVGPIIAGVLVDEGSTDSPSPSPASSDSSPSSRGCALARRPTSPDNGRVTARTLVLIRHAKSDWSNDLPDDERPLAPRGRRQAPAIGPWLVEHDLVPDLAVVSVARRAQETWEAVASGLGREVVARDEPAAYTFGGVPCGGSPAPSIRAWGCGGRRAQPGDGRGGRGPHRAVGRDADGGDRGARPSGRVGSESAVAVCRSAGRPLTARMGS